MLKDLFPFTMMVTQEMIDEGSKTLMSPTACIGARALRGVLKGSEYEDWSNKLMWGDTIGYVGSVRLRSIDPDTKEYVKMMYIKEPRSVTFIHQLNSSDD